MSPGERYRLVERIGQGGMATVWRAEDEQLGRLVAIKVLLPSVAERGDAAERFEREARALAGIRHANVLQLFDYLPGHGEAPARLVMELLSGPSLHRFVVDHGAPLPEVAALVAAEVAAGLAVVHARGIVHRDVKPENILLDGSRIVLTDFGIARIAVHERSAVTQTGTIIGSPAYMSPEQARGEEIDARSDQFAVGSLLYFLCTGSPPFLGPHPLVVMQRIDRVDYLPVGAKNPRVAVWLERIIKKCLQRDPASRYLDMATLDAALRRGLADDGLPEPAVELRRYFADRQAYNAALDGRLVEHRLRIAEDAWKKGERSRALAAVAAVLQVDARQPRALELFAELSRPEKRRLMLTALLVAGALGAAFLPVRSWWLTRAVPPPVAVAAVEPPTRFEPAIAVDMAVPVARPARPEKAAGKSFARAPTLTTQQPPPTAVVAAPAETTRPEPVAADTEAHLSVRTAPWCALTIDGRASGLTPQNLTLAPGAHTVRCVAASGSVLERNIELAAGEVRTIEERFAASAKLQPALTRGDAIRVDDDSPSRAARSLVLGRHRVTLLREGKELEARWLDIPERGCRLLDAPELRCDGP